MFFKRGRHGFTLVEIMSVVVVIGLLASIAIPYLSRVRINANEGAIQAELRTFSSACEGYRAKQNVPTYPPDIDALVNATNAYLDASWLLTDRPRHGYDLLYNAGTNSYSLMATPAALNKTAVKTYCIDQTGIISVSADGANALTGDALGCSGGAALAG